MDALAGHYDHEAHSLGVPVDWRLELPRQLAIPEADFCMMLGNLLENAFHASQKLEKGWPDADHAGPAGGEPL